MRLLSVISDGLKGFRDDLLTVERPTLSAQLVAILSVPLVLIIAGALYALLVLDANTPRSSWREQHVTGINTAYSLVELGRISGEMKQRHGERARTGLDNNGHVTVHLDGKLVEETDLPGELANVLGAFFVGPPGTRLASFPFSINPGHLQDELYPGELNKILKGRFEKRAPDQVRWIEESGWRRSECRVIQPADLGLGSLAPRLRLRAATACAVQSDKPSRRAVIVVVAADGDWLRPFAKRICRTAAVSAAANPAFAPRPDVAACVLVDRPAQHGADKALTAHAYEVRADGGLAWVWR